MRLDLPPSTAALRECIAVALRTSELIEAEEHAARGFWSRYHQLLNYDVEARRVWYVQQARERHAIHGALVSEGVAVAMDRVVRQELIERRADAVQALTALHGLAEWAALERSVWAFVEQDAANVARAERVSRADVATVMRAERSQHDQRANMRAVQKRTQTERSAWLDEGVRERLRLLHASTMALYSQS